MDELLLGLKEYRTALSTHVVQLQDSLLQIDNPWCALRVVYEGDAAEQFKVNWIRTLEEFQDYINTIQKIIAILDERIETLQTAISTQERLK